MAYSNQYESGDTFSCRRGERSGVTEDGERSGQTGGAEKAKAESASRPGTAGRAATAGAGSDGVDDAARSFLAVEAEFADPSGTARGQAVDVERVPAEDVPETFPVSITTPEALALSLDVGDTRAVTYFEWDTDRHESRLHRLLALKGVRPERFAELHGETILLEAREGHYVPYVPEETPRGSALGVYGIVAGLVANLLAVLLVFSGLGSLVGSVPFVVLWLTLTLVVVPVSTYVDAWHLRTRTTWDGGPLFWGTLAAVPGVNVLSSALYLLGRRRARALA
jgi:hypothetical protein